MEIFGYYGNKEASVAKLIQLCHVFMIVSLLLPLYYCSLIAIGYRELDHWMKLHTFVVLALIGSSACAIVSTTL